MSEKLAGVREVSSACASGVTEFGGAVVGVSIFGEGVGCGEDGVDNNRRIQCRLDIVTDAWCGKDRNFDSVKWHMAKKATL